MLSKNAKIGLVVAGAIAVIAVVIYLKKKGKLQFGATDKCKDCEAKLKDGGLDGYCEDCFENHGFVCARCGMIKDNEEMASTDDDDDDEICDDCNKKEEHFDAKEKFHISEKILPAVEELISAKRTGDSAKIEKAEKHLYTIMENQGVTCKKVLPNHFSDGEMAHPRRLAKTISCIAQRLMTGDSKYNPYSLCRHIMRNIE